MPRILAIDWDQHEARYVLAATRGKAVEVHAAASVPLVDVVVAGGKPHSELGDSLRSALAKEKLRQATTLVGIDRGSIELLYLTLPPAQDEELAQLVANQAIRESPNVTEDSVLDFLPLDDNPSQPRRVTAASLSQERLEQVKTACGQARLKPHRMILRSYASASLFSRLKPEEDRACLLVNLTADEVDLLVLDAGKVTFLRTIRPPRVSDADKTRERILSEIHRTLAVAAQSHPHTGPIECVYVFGGPDEHQGLIDRIAQELLLPATSLDPFEAVALGSTATPDHSGRFASLLGMILDEAHGSRHAIDFVHPRRPARPVDRRRVVAVAAAAVVALVAAAGYLGWGKLSEMDAKNRKLAGEVDRLEDAITRKAAHLKLRNAVRDWMAGDVIWLEELRELSMRLPSADDVVIRQMSMAPARSGGGGFITLKGIVRDSSTVPQLEHSLRVGGYNVRTPPVREGMREEDYPWNFDTTLYVNRTETGRPTSQLAGQP